MIEKLADDGLEVSLAVSLNATTDQVRDTMMPVNKNVSHRAADAGSEVLQ